MEKVIRYFSHLYDWGYFGEPMLRMSRSSLLMFLVRSNSFSIVLICVSLLWFISDAGINFISFCKY